MLSAERLLELDGTDPFRARFNLDNGNGAIFGGQLLGLALRAATLTAPAWPAHSLSGYFSRPARVSEPLDFFVTKGSDSRTFATRHVVARQGGRDVFEALCSFHEAEPGVEHQNVAPIERGPDGLATLGEYATANAARVPAHLLHHYTRDMAIELRPLEPESVLFGLAPDRDFWVRMPSATVHDPHQQQCFLALMSDYWLASGAACLPPLSPLRPNFRLVSLNHSLWLHAPARMEQWLLYRTEIRWAGNGRALARGTICDQQGRLVASAMQELLLRIER